MEILSACLRPNKAGAILVERGDNSPNQVLTHAARAAAEQLNKLLCHLWWQPGGFQPPLVAARGAREGLWLEQG